MTEETPIAWTALEQGAPVRASDGQELGKVDAVVADEQKDIFSGLVLTSGLLSPDRFVPAELIDTITDKGVNLTISPQQAEELETY